MASIVLGLPHVFACARSPRAMFHVEQPALAATGASGQERNSQQ